jgi:hypothetical protein
MHRAMVCKYHQNRTGTTTVCKEKVNNNGEANRELETWHLRVKNGIYVSSLKYAGSFDHSALVAGIARTCAQRGLAVKSEPILPGGKRADLAVGTGKNRTYVEVKTRSSAVINRGRGLSFRKDLLREILRLRAHSLKQLPKKYSSLIVLATSASPTRRKAFSKIAIARSFGDRIFDHDSANVMGLMIFAPFRSQSQSNRSWKYASTLIPNPNWRLNEENLRTLAGIQL